MPARLLLRPQVPLLYSVHHSHGGDQRHEQRLQDARHTPSSYFLRPGHLQGSYGRHGTRRFGLRGQIHRKASRRRTTVNSGSPAPLQTAQRRLHSRILALLLPAMLAVFLDPLMALTDTAIVGTLGTVPLGAVGLSNLIFFFTTVLFSFLLAVVTPRVAQAAAKGRQGSLETARALWLGAILGVLLSATLWLSAPWLMLQVFKVGQEQAALAVPHLRIRSLGSPATLVLFVLNGAFRGLTDTRTPLLAGLAQNSVNFGLDLLLVLGMHWGVTGAASATTAAFYVGAATMGGMLVVRGGLDPRDLRTLPSAGQALQLVREGLPLVLCIGSVVVAIFTATNLATGLGSVTLAAHTVVKQIVDFCMALLGSFSTAAQALVASSLSRGDIDEARRAVQRLLQFGLVLGSVMVAGLYAGHDYLPGLFSRDPAVVMQAGATLSVVAFSMLLAPCATTVEGTLLGAQQFVWVGGRTVASAAGAVAVLLTGSRLGWGLTGVWAGLVSLVALNCAGDSYRLLSVRSPLRLWDQRQGESSHDQQGTLGVQDKQDAEEREQQTLGGRR